MKLELCIDWICLIVESFSPLDAILRLEHAFAECGPYFSEMVSSGVFPQLIGTVL